MSNKKDCCKEMITFSEKMAGVSFHIGEEDEIQGVVSIDPSLGFVYFSDGHHTYPSLMLRYCPFCGQKA